MSGDLIPEEAIDAAAIALETGEVDADDPCAWFRGHAEAAVQAAAPLIRAAEVADFVRDLEALHADGGEIDELTAKWRARASVLRGEGHRGG